MVSYLYAPIPESENRIDWFLFADYKINLRAHVYYMGERLRWVILIYGFTYLVNSWEIKIIWWLSFIYFWDYFFFFNDSNYGIIKGVIMGVILIITGWKKSSRF